MTYRIMMKTLLATVAVVSVTACNSLEGFEKKPFVQVGANGQLEAQPPIGCPDWQSVNFLNYLNNQPLPNWSCATATNLAKTVARPESLVRGERMGPADGDYAAQAHERYRTGKTIPLLEEEDIGVVGSSGN